MTTSALALEAPTPLAALLEQQFSDDELAELLGLSDDSEVPAEIWQESLLGPLRDFLGRRGKGFRANLVTLSWHLAKDGGTGRAAQPPWELPLLVEILHAGSLIIDDIQDGSSTRRGLPALHRTWGEARALNAGNWLYFWPYILLERLQLEPLLELRLHRELSRVLMRCHHGQALDLTCCIFHQAQRDVPAAVCATTRLKTGCLMELAAKVGAIAAGADHEEAEGLGRFGHELGVGLQMLDDLGGVTSARKAHKGREDLIHGRPTWVWAWLAETLDPVTFARLQHRARAVADGAEAPDELLATLGQRIGSAARARVHDHLMGALAQLRQRYGDRPLTTALAQEIDRLEKSYE